MALDMRAASEDLCQAIRDAIARAEAEHQLLVAAMLGQVLYQAGCAEAVDAAH